MFVSTYKEGVERVLEGENVSWSNFGFPPSNWSQYINSKTLNSQLVGQEETIIIYDSLKVGQPWHLAYTPLN